MKTINNPEIEGLRGFKVTYQNTREIVRNRQSFVTFGMNAIDAMERFNYRYPKVRKFMSIQNVEELKV